MHKFILQSFRALTLAFYFAPVLLTLPLYKFFPSFHDRWWGLLVKAIEVPSICGSIGAMMRRLYVIDFPFVSCVRFNV